MSNRALVRRVLRAAISLGVIAGVGVGSWWLLRPTAAADRAARATVAGLQRDEQSHRFARALKPVPFVFPDDHGPHNDFQTEWWYYTGNVFTPEGRHFGYQLTFFRRALVPPDEQSALEGRTSRLAFNQLYFAHFALTDTDANEHVAFERYSRGAADLAGAQAHPFRVFVHNWFVQSARDDGDAARVRLFAEQDGYAIDLTLESQKPIVLHGERGLSQKSNTPGIASYYYSMTRLITRGRITTPRGTFEVQGQSWLDREWSTSALDDDVEGWDWFSLQFDDGREVMFFKLRQRETGATTFAKGTLITADGSTMLLRQDDVRVRVLERWTSPHTNATYPVRWQMDVLPLGLTLNIRARVSDQEMRLTQRYWEGAVTFEGSATQGETVRGVGYVEMTGY